ncbi:hypothetical protein [uncultured Shewanella sp.]|uniref:hypothetical protein n=1 Tax=uncultured Shewanella sp. TaxID=173975 RepID=UPI00262A6C39|nr:hypothetical protein [uncultured Shewanella sp.]
MFKPQDIDSARRHELIPEGLTTASLLQILARSISSSSLLGFNRRIFYKASLMIVSSLKPTDNLLILAGGHL